MCISIAKSQPTQPGVRASMCTELDDQIFEQQYDNVKAGGIPASFTYTRVFR
jgi:hypothetical protein